MQELPGGWYAAMEPYLGGRAREFLRTTWKNERPMLSGEGDYLPSLAATLVEFGDPATILFVDDSEPNVDGARSAGLRAEHWHLDQGHDALLLLLARHGVVVDAPLQTGTTPN